MRTALSAQALLALWDQGRSQTPGRRALELLAAGTNIDPAELAAWNVGRRERALLAIAHRLVWPALCEPSQLSRLRRTGADRSRPDAVGDIRCSTGATGV